LSETLPEHHRKKNAGPATTGASMKRQFIIISCLLFFFAHSHVFAQTIQREISLSNEKQVNVELSASFGSVNVRKGVPDKIVQVSYRKKQKDKDASINLDYSITNTTGELLIELHPEKTTYSRSKKGEVSVHVNDVDFRSEEWYVALTDAVPISLEAELGAGKSSFDLTGLRITNLSISTGASKSSLSFDERNSVEMEELKIETGVSKFSADNLNNANFKKMSFESGVGSYYLDFGGDLTRTVDVSINVGLGAVTVVIPKKIGVKVRYEESWLSNFSIDDDLIRKRKGTYESDNYESAPGRMNIFIEAGLGSVKVKRSR
jgi:predicted membrane protein